MKKNAKIFSILACFALLSSCGTTNGNVVLKLIDDVYHGTYEVGCPIDVENFVYCSARDKASISVTYTDSDNKSITEEIKGHVYYPVIAGTHLFSYSVSDKTVEKEVSVVDAVPSLSIDSVPYVASLNETVYFDELIDDIRPQYAPKDATLSVYGVEHRFAPIDLNETYGEWESVSFEKDSFVVSEMGQYRVAVRVENGTKTTSGYINVSVARKNKDGNDGVYKNDKTGKYYSNNVIIGENEDIYRLPASNYNDMSYVVLNDDFKLGDALEVKFKGKNLPSIGMYLEGNSLSYSPFDPYSAKGYFLTWEYGGTSRYVLYGPECLSSKAVKVAVEKRNEYWGYQDLEDDKHYSMKCYISGNSNSSGTYTHYITWTLAEILDYGTSNERYGDVVKSLNASGWTDKHSITKGKFALYSSLYKDITFQVKYGLEKIEEGVYLSKGTKTAERTYKFDKVSYSNDKKNGHSATSGFIGFKGDYGADDKISFRFKGKNIPNVALFCDDLSSMCGGGKGLYLSTGTNDKTLLTRLTVYGPYRLDSGNPSDYDAYDTIGYNNRLYSQINSPYGYRNLDDSKEYIYTISILKAASSNVSLTLTLHSLANDGGWTLEDTTNLSINNYTGPLSGNIIAYPTFDSNAANGTTFSYYPLNYDPFN